MSLELGCANDRELNERVTSADLSEWMAYYRLEPFGQDRTDLMLAQLCSLFANANRGRNSSPYKITDFLPGYEQEPEDYDVLVHKLKAAGA